jgi:L-ascorbate metabolism protein UlaG (beta-lactamase superfamily)
MVWLGHSSWYLQLAGKRILIDPVFSDYAAPFSFINKAFPATIRGGRKGCRRSIC